MRMTVIRGPVEAGPFELREGDNFAGRAPECDLCLPSKKVSRRHATVMVRDGRVVVKDLESHNGVVDAEGRRVATLPLSSGGRVQIGDFLLVLEGIDSEVELDDDDLIEMEMDLDDADDVDLDDEEIPDEPQRSRRPPPDPGSTGISPLARPPSPPKRLDTGPNLLGRTGRPAPPSPADLRRPDPPARGPAVESQTAATAAARGETRSPDRTPPVEKGFAAERLAGPMRSESKPRTPPPEGPVRAEDIVIRGLDDPPPGKAKKPKSEDLHIRGLDPEPPRSPRAEPPRAEPPRPVAPPPTPRSPAAAPRPMASASSTVRARDPAPPAVDSPVAPRPAAPLPRFEPVEVPATGVPWFLQAVLLFGLAWAVLVCTPFGGVLGQFRAADGRLESATRAYAVQVATTLAARNALALVAEDRANVDLTYATTQPGVLEARVADSRGMVLAPPEKYRISLGNREVYQRAAQSLTTTVAETGGSRVEIVVPAQRSVGGEVGSGGMVGGEIVGWAWVEVDLDAMGAATAAPWWSALPPLFAAGFGSVLLLFNVWWLLLRPLSALAAGADRALASEGGLVRPSVRLGAIERLSTALNTAIGRARHGGG